MSPDGRSCHRFCSMFGVVGRAALVAICAANAVSSAEPRDPIIRPQPASRPEFRELATGGVYESRLQKALATLGDWMGARISEHPAAGLRIVGLLPDSPLARQGLRSGDVIGRINGVIAWGPLLPEREPALRLDYFSSSEQTLMSLTTKADPVGVTVSSERRPEFEYLRSERRNTAWDRDVLGGIVARGSDPDLAETAWRQALVAGYQPDALSDQMGAEIALSQNRPDVADEFAWFAEQQWRADADVVDPVLLYRVALADFHLGTALDIVQRAPYAFEPSLRGDLQRLIAVHASHSLDERTAPSPSEQAATMYRDNLLSRLRGCDRVSIEGYLPQLREGREFSLDAETARYQTARFELRDPTPNVELTARISARTREPTQDVLPRSFVVRWQSVAAAGPGVDRSLPPTLLSLEINEWGAITINCNDVDVLREAADPALAGMDQGPHEIRMLRIGGQAELFLNGHRIYYGPVAARAVPMQFEIVANGVQAVVHGLIATELVEQP